MDLTRGLRWPVYLWSSASSAVCTNVGSVICARCGVAGGERWQRNPRLLWCLALKQVGPRPLKPKGLDQVFRAAGFEWREKTGLPRCVLGPLNPDRLEAARSSASSSNAQLQGSPGLARWPHPVDEPRRLVGGRGRSGHVRPMCARLLLAPPHPEPAQPEPPFGVSAARATGAQSRHHKSLSVRCRAVCARAGADGPRAGAAGIEAGADRFCGETADGRQERVPARVEPPSRSRPVRSQVGRVSLLRREALRWGAELLRGRGTGLVDAESRGWAG